MSNLWQITSKLSSWFDTIDLSDPFKLTTCDSQVMALNETEYSKWFFISCTVSIKNWRLTHLLLKLIFGLLENLCVRLHDFFVFFELR